MTNNSRRECLVVRFTGVSQGKALLEEAALGANILHVSHDRRAAGVVLGRTEVRSEFETRGPEHIKDVIEQLELVGYGAELEG